jgi:transposase InsO family protein
VKIQAIIDSGATSSFISKRFCTSQNIPVSPSSHTIILANDKKIAPSGSAVVELASGDLKMSHEFLVMDLLDDIDCFIGLDLFKSLNISFGTFNKSQYFNPPASIKEKELDDSTVIVVESAEFAYERTQLLSILQPELQKNEEIPLGSFCKHPLAVVHLPTDSAPPVYRRQYPIPFKLQSVVDSQVQSWLDHGIIERISHSSNYNNPLLVVPKKDSHGNITSHRVCLDPRLLNVHIPDSPIKVPLVQDIFERLSGSRIFSTLDYVHSFLQWPLFPSDREKTAFTWNNHQYQFKGAPFGLKPITGVVQQTQNAIFNDCSFVEVYVDDIIIHSKTLADHILHLEKVLQLLNINCIKLNLKKCHFIATKVKLLGHLISQNSIEIDPAKQSTLKNWPLPLTGSQIQSFLGFTNYFRKFIPLYSTLAAPLESLRNYKSFQLNDLQIQSFSALKNAILKAPILKLANFELPFAIATDASATGIAAVLFQDTNEGRNYISFEARSLSPSEKNYSATKRELLAIVFALKRFHYYIYLSKFTLYSDHKAPTHLFTQKHTNAMILNWFDTLLDYNFDIVHIAGKDNTVPDSLSRIASITAQINCAIQSLDEQLVIPSSEDQKTPLEKAHLAGHFGSAAMVNHIKLSGYNWPTLRKDALKLISSCPTCQRYNIAKRGFHPLKTITASLPFDHISIDLLGPLPTTQAGYNYILVHIDVLTRFVILKPLMDKTSMTIARHLVSIWSQFGYPKIVQSDNGTEFVNSILKQLVKISQIDHRLITAYHPRADGLVEKWVDLTKRTLRKSINADLSSWEKHVPTVQFYLNNKVQSCHGSTPFSLMFARSSNSFTDYTTTALKPLSDDLLLERLKNIQSILFPAISAKLQTTQNKTKHRFDTTKNLLSNPFPDGSFVMRRDATRSSTLQPYYEGPFKILKRTSGGSYVLQDSTGALLPRNAAPSQLKIISYAPDSTQTSFEIDAILDHRGEVNYDRAYLVKWKHDHPNSWIPERDFDDVDCITQYWKRRITPQASSFLEGGNVMTEPQTQTQTISANNKPGPQSQKHSKNSKRTNSSTKNQSKIKIRLRHQ